MLTPPALAFLLHCFFYLGIEASQVMGFPEKITFAVVLLCVKPFISIILLLTTALRKRNGYH